MAFADESGRCDSERFHHVCPGEPIISIDDADGFDSLSIVPTPPIILDDEIRLYYGGSNELGGRDGKKRWRDLPRGLACCRWVAVICCFASPLW